MLPGNFIKKSIFLIHFWPVLTAVEYSWFYGVEPFVHSQRCLVYDVSHVPEADMWHRDARAYESITFCHFPISTSFVGHFYFWYIEKIQLQRIIWELTLKIIFDFFNKWYCRVYRTLSKLSYFWWDSSAKLYSQHKLRTWWDGIDVDRKWEARRAKGNLLDGTGGPMIVGGVGQGGILQERRDRGLMALPK